MAFTGAFINPGSFLANGCCCTAMALLRCDEPDGAVAMFMDVPVHKGGGPLAGLLLAGKRPAGVVGPVFDGAEQSF